VLTSSGEERIIAWNNAIIRDHSGSITGTFSSGQDITGQKQAEDLFRTTFNRSPVGLYIAVKGKFVLVNPQFCKWAGYSEQELEGKETLSLVYPEDMGRVRREAIRSLKSSREHVHSYDYRFKTHDGHIRWFMESVTSIRFNGRPATLGSIVDISERKDNEELFRSLSMVDDLTGLYNRRGFLTLASKELQLSFRLERGASILFADVDKLKSINDGFGHLEGDAALISAARMLKEAFRESDIIGRIMGDEFAVFMLGADQEYASGIIARMQARLQEYNSTSGKPYQLTLSFGLATSPAGKPCNLGDLLQTADRYMYRQKRNGN
jgi:diguanylate cyclase (GGDEF)-like protein/PAS domain S-box-containing protein